MAATRALVVFAPGPGLEAGGAVREILVAPGDRVEAGDPLVALESAGAVQEVVAPAAGLVTELRVVEGDAIAPGDALLALEVSAPARAEAGALGEDLAPRAARSASEPRRGAPGEPAGAVAGEAPREAPGGAPRASPRPLRADVLVLGGGPGGYTAAFRAADLGRRVVLAERFPALGGVCLHVGCIPSKALLHAAEVLEEARELAAAGVGFGAPKIDAQALRAHAQRVVARLADGLARLARQRGVEVLTGAGRFESPTRARVEGAEGPIAVDFDHAVVAVGSRPIELPGLPRDPRIWDSTDALALDAVPERLLVIGGGVIGLEMATLFSGLGARVSVLELLPELLTGVDPELVRPLRRRLGAHLDAIWCGARVAEVTPERDALRVRLEGPGAPAEARFDRVLVAVGRRGRGGEIGAERAGLRADERGHLGVDAKQRTSVPHVFAIGDVTGPPLLAHRAMHQGRVAAEVIAGLPAEFDPRAVPSVAYTDPEVAWCGISEGEARERGIEVDAASFPWAANGRALGLGRGEGLTKLLFAKGGGRLLGAGVVGARAGELIAEAVVAMELGADAEDLALAIHPHPTLSETLGLAAEVAAGTITDLAPARRGRS